MGYHSSSTRKNTTRQSSTRIYINKSFMRKYTFVHYLSCIIGLCFIGTSAIYAQSPSVVQDNPVAKTEADYRFQFDLYRTAYNKYLVDKSEYLKNQTLISEQEALTSAKDAILARADVYRAYDQWLRIDLLQFKDIYPNASQIADKLELQTQWFLEHKIKVTSTGNKTSFDQVVLEYSNTQLDRERVFTLAQIELKLAKLYKIRLEIQKLYDSIRPILTPQIGVPEVEQGLIRSDNHLKSIDEKITSLSNEVKVLAEGGTKSEKNDPKRVSSTSIKKLESIRSEELDLVTILTELEQNYGTK